MHTDLSGSNLFQKADEGTEARYEEQYFNEALGVIRIAFPVVIFLYAVFGFLDETVVSEHQSLFHAIRYGVVVPFLIGVYLCSFFSVFRKIWQLLLFLSFMVAGMGIVVMIITEPENFSYYAGLMLIFSAGYVFIKLKFIYATVAGWSILIVFNILMFTYTNPAPSLIISYNFFYAAANIINMLAAYYIESSFRQTFLLNQQLVREQRALAQANETLESEVERRTMELAARESELRESNKAKDRFISIIGHDLRSPLAAIREIADYMCEAHKDLSGSKRLELMGIIRQSAANMYKLLENLLQLARSQRGHMTSSPERINLSQKTDSMMALLAPLAAKKDIKLDSQISADLEVRVDPGHFETVLRNLVSNAIKFSNPGCVVAITAQPFQENVQTSVTDNGVGIPESSRHKIFKMDTILRTTGTAKERGTGLGLILCKELVEKNGGRIWMESPAEGGTRVHFTLPR